MPVLTITNKKAIDLHATELADKKSGHTTSVNQPIGAILPCPDNPEAEGKQQSLGEFLRASPLYGLDLDFTRDKSLPREISLD